MKYSEAIANYKKAFTIKPERIVRDCDEVKIFSNIARAYSEISEYQSSIEYLFQYLEKDCIKKDSSEKSKSYNQLGINYNYLSQNEQALKFYKKAIEMAGSDTGRMASVYNNIANIYQQNKELDKAIEYYQNSLKYFKAIDYYYGEVAVTMNIAIIEAMQNKVEIALSYYEQSKRMAEEHGDTLQLIAIYINMGEYYTQVTDYKKAEEYLNWALKQSMLKKSRSLIMESYKSLVKLYEANKDYSKAFVNLKKYNEYTDSIFMLNSSRDYAELEAKYSLREKDQQNQTLQKEQEYTELKFKSQRKYIWMLLGIVVLALLSMGLFYLQRIKLIKTKKALEIQHKEITKSQKQLKDLNHQYEKLIEKYEGDNKLSNRAEIF
ncbi:MAG: tetratricopeptide repeat protein [Bacteroidales bacterium]|nr:tetratricopeptide repeat protein [Bacteroidales bacterium]